MTGKVIIGNGDPEGKDVGDVGDFYVRTDGAVGTLYYVKATGAATSTGWIAKATLP